MAGDIRLKTISKNGRPPETRLEGAYETSELVNALIEADGKRNSTDNKVKGMMDGNPPYSDAMLAEQNQSWRTNVNWRIGESFLNTALTTYWNLFDEGPTKATVVTHHGNDSAQREEWGNVITEEFERLNKDDRQLATTFRRSQHDMVLFRMGPMMWQDAFDYRARPIKCQNLLTLDKTPVSIDEWKMVVVRTNYTADELYGSVQNAKAATAKGWNVKHANKVLMDSYPTELYRNRTQDWSFYQQSIRNNDLHWSTQCESIPVAHVFCREFPKGGELEGRISHFAVVEGDPADEYLYKHVGRYENWRQVICPFYYDTGDGDHHSVKGMGNKMFGALDKINKLMGHECDLAFIGSGLNFQFRGAVDKEKMQLMTMGVVNFWDEGIQLLNTAFTGQLIQAPSQVRNEILNTVTANTAQYRQGLEREQGNPITARQVSYQAENQNLIGKSNLTYYFEQSDDFYTERYRRASNPNLTENVAGGREAIAFQRRCQKRGVPKEAMALTTVTATRTVGFGSADAKLQALMRMLARIQMYSETGQKRILQDITIADVGPTLMRRYIPESQANPTLDFQRSQAQDKVGLIKQGIPPLVTADQDPVVFAETYIMAAAQAMESLQQGGNPAEVAAFVDLAGQSALQQMQRFANDPMRSQIYQELKQRLDELAKMNDQLMKQLQQQGEQQQQDQQATQQFMSEEQRKNAKNEADISRKERKLQVDLSAKNAKTRQGLAVTDLQSAQQFRINEQKARNGNGSKE